MLDTSGHHFPGKVAWFWLRSGAEPWVVTTLGREGGMKSGREEGMEGRMEERMEEEME